MSHHLQLERIEIFNVDQRIIALDAEVASGDVLTIMGRSGVGKTTLLNAIAGFLDKPFKMTGRVMIDGRDVTSLPPEHRHVGLIFQDPLLFPHMSVGENLAFALPGSVGDRRKRIETALAMAGLAGYADRDPATLSGGQRSRIALMRALISQPSVLLMDEPFSRLDTRLRHEVRELTFSLVRKAGLPAILVTHDRADADATAGRIIDLDE